MQYENLIPVEVCHTHYKAESSFIRLLHEYGFIHIVSVEEKQFIEQDELQTFEKLMHLHYDLDINMEGIEAIRFLLERVQAMQDEIAYLKSRLNAAVFPLSPENE